MRMLHRSMAFAGWTVGSREGTELESDFTPSFREGNSPSPGAMMRWRKGPGWGGQSKETKRAWPARERTRVCEEVVAVEIERGSALAKQGLPSRPGGG